MARIDWRVAQWWRPFATLGVAFGVTIVMMIALGVVVLAWEGLGLPAASESLEDGGNPADLMASRNGGVLSRRWVWRSVSRSS